LRVHSPVIKLPLMFKIFGNNATHNYIFTSMLLAPYNSVMDTIMYAMHEPFSSNCEEVKTIWKSICIFKCFLFLTDVVLDLLSPGQIPAKYWKLVKVAILLTHKIVDTSHLFPADVVVKEATIKLVELKDLLDQLQSESAGTSVASSSSHSCFS
jgi:hypothetical protein